MCLFAAKKAGECIDLKNSTMDHNMQEIRSHDLKKTWPAGGRNHRSLNKRRPLTQAKKTPEPLPHPYTGHHYPCECGPGPSFCALAWRQARGFFNPSHPLDMNNLCISQKMLMTVRFGRINTLGANFILILVRKSCTNCCEVL